MKMNIITNLLKFFNFLKHNKFKIVIVLQCLFVVASLIFPSTHEKATLEGTIVFICISLMLAYICLIVNCIVNFCVKKTKWHILYILKYILPILISLIMILFLQYEFSNNHYHNIGWIFLILSMFII